MFLCFQALKKGTFPIFYWSQVNSSTANFSSFDFFPCNKSQFSPRCVNTERLEKKNEQNVGEYAAFETVSLGMSCCVFASRCKEWWCEAFSNLYLSAFYCTGISLGRRRWDHYTVYVWCAPSVTGEIFNWTEPTWGVFFYNALLQPDTAGLFTCTIQQANHHLVLTGAFHEPMMSAFNPPCCALSVTLLISRLTATCMNKQDFFDSRF